MAKPDRIIKLEVSVTANLGALRRRIAARLRAIRRVLNFGPPFHTFAEVEEHLRRGWETVGQRPATKCMWCQREEKWWRRLEKCNFQVMRKSPFGGREQVDVQHTNQVSRT